MSKEQREKKEYAVFLVRESLPTEGLRQMIQFMRDCGKTPYLIWSNFPGHKTCHTSVLMRAFKLEFGEDVLISYVNTRVDSNDFINDVDIKIRRMMQDLDDSDLYNKNDCEIFSHFVLDGSKKQLFSESSNRIVHEVRESDSLFPDAITTAKALALSKKYKYRDLTFMDSISIREERDQEVSILSRINLNIHEIVSIALKRFKNREAGETVARRISGEKGIH